MPKPAKKPQRLLSKSKFSQYLRTQCDKELYLSLFKSKEECIKLGIPAPLKSRTGVQLVTKSGQEFEYDQYDQLIMAIPDNVIHNSNGRGPVNLIVALGKSRDKTFILQPEIEPELFRDDALSNLGLDSNEMAAIPTLAGLKPDVLFVREKIAGEFEILPDGSRAAIVETDPRLAISVIDLKNVIEGNASYSGEVCLYAFFLANWLVKNPDWHRKFFISDQIYLWKHTEMPNFSALLKTKAGGDAHKKVDALIKDLNEGLVDYLIYMPSVRKFFKEDVPRVVVKGDEQGWSSLDYHVNPKCSACDWLGHRDWLVRDDLKIFDANPDHYCLASADGQDHLCKLTNLSKGATQILAKNGHPKVQDIAGISVTSLVLRKHALLKREKSQIGRRATAITTGVSTRDDHNKIAGLARYVDAEYHLIVNFDAGAGLLTGVAMRGTLSAPYGTTFDTGNGEQTKFLSYKEQAFVVNRDVINSEWAVLSAFIERLSFWIAESDRIFRSNSLGPVHTQICFWEERQYEELCNAFGRHLLKILDLDENAQKALAWLFPAEELIEREEQIAPGIVFIRDIIDMAVHLPVKFVNTLLGVAEYYHAEKMEPREVDKYYREVLGNAIPRERIFEIWKSTTGTVKKYGREISVSEAIKEYEKVLRAQTWALNSVTARLRSDFRGSLQGTAPSLNLAVLRGTSGVAYDAKLWLQWEKVNSATSSTEWKATLVTSVDRLESSYKAIVLTKLIKDHGNKKYDFEVSEDSTEAKLEEGGEYFVLGIVGQPGFPLQTASKLGLEPLSEFEIGAYRTPFNRLITVKLELFDRANKRATIVVRPSFGKNRPVFDELFSKGLVPIFNNSIYLMDGPSPSFLDHTDRVLKDVGNPIYATPAKEALGAMGNTAKKRSLAGKDASTPIAEILWKAKDLADTTVRTDGEALAIARYAKNANEHQLNQSQEDTVFACAKSKLSVIWGPPGTGKTDTLVAFIHAIVHEAQTINKSKKILITGPNYRAVEELIFRLIGNLSGDKKSVCDLFMVYSKSREPRTLPDIPKHLNAYSFSLDKYNPECSKIRTSMQDKNKVTIIGTTVHQIIKITDFMYGVDSHSIQNMFDLAVIDESSQVEIVRAIQPMAVLKNTGQLVVAGDHLQMPPISQLEPPRGAEYLVGSIQTYLIERFNLEPQKLLVNYRSNQDLVDYAKTIGYPGNLVANNRIKKIKHIVDIDDVINSLPAELPQTRAYRELLRPERAVTTLIHEDIVSSQANELEAKLVAGLAYAIRHAASSSLDIGDGNAKFLPFDDGEFFKNGLGVVTPHKAQKALVIKELKLLFPNVDGNLIYNAVDTVERFQGGQRHTIIISYGVGDVDIIGGEEAFLLQKERTNVAVSRAQAKCIILMPKSLAYHLPSEQDTVETCRAIKSYVEEFCNNREHCEIEIDGDIRAAEVRWH